MRDSETRDVGGSLLSLVALTIVGFGGYVYLTQPLESARPRPQMPEAATSPGTEDADARLWQDPLEAIRQHYPNGDKEKHWQEQHDAKTLKKQIDETAKDAAEGSTLIMPVMTRGGPYAEDIEVRIRTRYAVNRALLEAGYVPNDSEHLGTLMIESWPDAEEKSENTAPVLLAAFEWFRADPFYDSAQAFRNVLVLWVDEKAVSDKPLDRFEQLFRMFVSSAASADASNGHTIRVLGPSSSTTFRNIELALLGHPRQESKQGDADGPQPVPACQVPTGNASGVLDSLQNVRFISPWATIPTFLARAEEDPCSPGSSFDGVADVDSASRKSEHPGPRIQRVTNSDDKLMVALLNELRLRGIEPGSDSDNILIVSDADTDYGRMQSRLFASASRCRADRPTAADAKILDCIPHEYERLAKLPRDWPKNIVTFAYLRGVDGTVPRLPGKILSEELADLARTLNSGAKAGRGTPVVRQAAGPGQFDYIRLLGKDTETTFGTSNPPKAVGVLGSDVYDKLLLIRVLRERFPDAVFFTTDLDRRLLHPSELPYTRNLIVASHFGLESKVAYKRCGSACTPQQFRDTYQTGVFRACLTALDAVDGNASEPPDVRRFEIGRGVAYDLTPAQARPIAGGLLARILITVGLGGALICLSAPRLFRRALQALENPEQETTRRRARWCPRPGWAIFLVSCAAFAVLGVTACRDHVYHRGEPFSFVAGVSSWPAHFIRLTAGLGAIASLVFVNRSLRWNARRLEEEFIFGSPDRAALSFDSPGDWADPPVSSFPADLDRFTSRLARLWDQPKRAFGEFRHLLAKFMKWRRSVAISEWEAPAKDVPILTIWSHYRRLGKTKYRFLRTLPSVIVFFAFGLSLLQIFGQPFVPFRGATSQFVHETVLRFAVLAMLVLTFYVVDATRLCGRFVTILASRRTRWSPDVLERIGGKASGADEATTEWLDVSLIGRRSEVVDRLVYYPAAVVLLMAVSRTNYFDRWGFPVAIAFLVGIMVLLLCWCVFVLRSKASAARASSIERLTRARLGQREAGDTIDFAIERIREFAVGAYAPLSQQPLVKAILVPTGGLGALSIVELLGR